MLLSMIRTYGLSRIGLAMIILTAFCAMVALICHEVAHGWVANKLGDPTAKQEGRLTLNPAAHIDPVGMLLLLLVGFGWAKPVPINTRYFKNPRRDIALVSAAGPLANFLLALVSGVLYVLCIKLAPEAGLGLLAGESVSPMFVLQMLFLMLMSLNLGLGLFNLIPLPPLDGSNILVSFLKPNTAAKYLRVRYYVRYILLGVMLVSVLASYSTLFARLDYIIWWPLMQLRNLLTDLILWLGNLLFFWL